MLVRGFGLLNYSNGADGYRLVVDADEEIVNYYRKLVPPWFPLNRTRYPAHITVVREATLPVPELWGVGDGDVIEFEYSPIIRTGEEGPWAPGYYSTLFEDPDGIRIEALFIPGSGNLDRIKDAPLMPVG